MHTLTYIKLLYYLSSNNKFDGLFLPVITTEHFYDFHNKYNCLLHQIDISLLERKAFNLSNQFDIKV